MKKYIFVLISILFILAPTVQASNFSHIKTGTVNYASSYLPDSLKSQVISWQAKYTDFFDGGLNPKAFSANNIWVGYQTIIGFYSTPLDPTYNNVKSFSDANGYIFENIFIHMKQDYTAIHPWNETSSLGGMDKFDAFDKTGGVIVDNAGVLTDKSTEGYNTNAGDVSFSSNLYVGYGMPFAEMNFIISQNSSNMVGSWQYWNGSSWINLPQITDGTNKFSASGKITFTPPSNWARTGVNNSMQKYFLRYKVTSAAIFPKISKIYGDNLMTGSKARGWNSSDPNIVNKGLGELEYNPNPPANATAKFRYQARATGFWGPTYVFVNQAYISNGKRVWAEFSAQKTVDSMLTTGYDGVMFDSLGGTMRAGISDPVPNPENYSDFVDYTSNSWDTESLQSFGYLANKIHSLRPSAKVGGNTGSWAYASLADFTLKEYAAAPAIGGSINIASYSSTVANYDNYLPQNNPNGKIIVYMFQDTLDHRGQQGGAYWDRSNRGPITTLASHYITKNDNTYLHYFSEGGWRYDETDEIFVYDSHTTTLTQNLAPDTSINTKYIYGADFSAFPFSGSRNKAKIGNNVMIYTSFTKVNNTTLSTNDPIYYPVSAGAVIKFVSSNADRMSNHEAAKDYPSIDNVWRWANYFPAEFVDVGQPDPNGWNGGNRGLWNGIYRRDFTKAIALYKMGASYTTKDEFDTYSAPFDLGGTYYPLKADGRLSAAVSQLSLRAGEGAILMKQGTPSGDITPPASPTGVTVL